MGGGISKKAEIPEIPDDLVDAKEVLDKVREAKEVNFRFLNFWNKKKIQFKYFKVGRIQKSVRSECKSQH